MKSKGIFLEKNFRYTPLRVNLYFMSWYVYIAEARTKRYYTGISNNVDGRIGKHNSRKGSQMAIQQGPFKLVYQSEPLKDKAGARIREIQIKGWSRKKKEKLIRGEWK